MAESLADIIRRFLGESPNDPAANYERDFGMTGGELGPRTGHPGYGQSYRPNPNYIPPGSSPSMNMDWSKVRDTQRPGYEREPSPYDESAITKLAAGRDVGLKDFAFPTGEKMPDAVQRQEGMGLNNIAGRHGSFPLTKPPFGTTLTLDTVLPEMGYDYTNEGYTDFTPMGHDYTNEGYAAGWQTPSAAIGGVEDPGDFAGENRDLLRLGQARAPVRQRPTAHPSMAGIPPTFGMRRPGTSFDANIEVEGSPGGWFTPEEYGRNYYKFGRGS